MESKGKEYISVYHRNFMTSFIHVATLIWPLSGSVAHILVHLVVFYIVEAVE